MFRKARNRVNSPERQNKKRYFREKFSEHKGDTKARLQVIIESMRRKICSHSACIDVNCMSVSDKVVEQSDKVTENNFGYFYSKIGSTVHERVRNYSKNFYFRWNCE